MYVAKYDLSRSSVMKAFGVMFLSGSFSVPSLCTFLPYVAV